ncbi:MAG: uncharacterized membrane protein YheB (UPF0754 family) [Rickettsiales bacterium]|jgi:uncharacterized membrane protein YheB (UPF0754 family)
MTGIFALSGSLTNWIAIHMLFEKVPFLYGSGVILNRFEDFKIGIKNLIVNEFFNKKHIEQFFTENGGNLSADAINDKIDFDKVFEGLKDAIIESPMGSMLSMFGGREALDPLKDPIVEKLKNIAHDLASDKDGNSGDSKNDLTENLIEKIEKIIDKRLEDLTPKMVKNLIQEMIKKHLGWLVVWGGIFGGLIGLVFTIIS